ncbi:MAG TPA: asparagine synthase-related protein [Azospirillum sp.]
MSVFAGVVAFDGDAQRTDSGKRLAAALEPYGGNRERLWTAPQAVFVHRQRIVTPEDRAERQPVAAAEGTLAFDGRLDNRDDLIAALGLDARSAPLPDSRIVLAALGRWGDRAPERLLGDFAFAFWDATARRLTLVCDQLGSRAIYYHRGAGMVVFATMVHAVQALPHVPREVDEAALADVLMDLGVPADRSLYRGIARVPAAGRVVIGADSLHVERYWEPDFGRRVRMRDDEYVEAGRELLDRAVAVRLRAEGRVVAQITGGLDSSAVAATAARLMAPNVLKTLTMLPEPGAPMTLAPGRYADERPYVEAIARLHPNIEPHFAHADDTAAVEEDPAELFAYAGMPFRGIMNVGWFSALRTRTRALGADVVLVGSAGNLTLSWNGRRSLADQFRSGRWFRLMREAVGLSRTTGEPLRDVLRSEVAAPLAPLTVRRLYRRLRGGSTPLWQMHTAINPDWAGEHDVPGRLWRNGRLGPYDVTGGDAEARREMIESNQAARGLLAAMRPRAGFETRDPLGDLRLLEFCFALPASQYLRGGVPRSFARRVLADRLPPEVVHNTRSGKQAPEWFHRLNRRRDALVAELERLNRSPLARRCLDLPRMKAIAADWPADVESGYARSPEFYSVLGRGVHIGQFLRWVERGNE